MDRPFSNFSPAKLFGECLPCGLAVILENTGHLPADCNAGCLGMLERCNQQPGKGIGMCSRRTCRLHASRTFRICSCWDVCPFLLSPPLFSPHSTIPLSSSLPLSSRAAPFVQFCPPWLLPIMPYDGVSPLFTLPSGCWDFRPSSRVLELENVGFFSPCPVPFPSPQRAPILH